MEKKYNNVFIDYLTDGRKSSTEDKRFETIEELVEFLYDIGVASRGQAEVYATDGILKLNIRN